MEREESRKKKSAVWLKLWKYLDGYTKVLVANCSDISATMMKEMKRVVEPLGASILMAKNTLIKAGIKRKMQKPEKSDEDYEIRSKTYRPMPELQSLLTACNGDIAFIFCKDNIMEVKEKLQEFKCEKVAKVGVISPCDVVIKKGITWVDPK